MKIRIILPAMAAIALAAGAFALPPEEPPPPEPPKEINDCSPGFWKNHTEYWDGGIFCADDACVDFVLAQLKAKGPGSGDIRQGAADALNAWADSYYGALICTD